MKSLEEKTSFTKNEPLKSAVVNPSTNRMSLVLIVWRQCRTVNKVSSALSSSENVLIKVYSQSDRTNSVQTRNFCNFIVSFLFDASSDAITQR